MIHVIAIFLLKYAMVALMLAVGLSTTPMDLRHTWAERGLMLRALLVLELGVPLLALATVKVLPLGFIATGIIAIMAVCPGAPMIAAQVRGRAVVLVLLALVSVFAPITVSAWVAVLDRALPHALLISPGAAVRTMVLKQALPLAVGAGIAALAPQVARWLARLSSAGFLVGFAVALLIVLAKGGPELLHASPWAILAVLVVVVGSIAMGHAAGRPRLADSRTLAIMAALGNPALGAAVIAESYPNFKAGALIAAYLIARALVLLPYSLYTQRRLRRARPRGRRGPVPSTRSPGPRHARRPPAGCGARATTARPRAPRMTCIPCVLRHVWGSLSSWT